MKKIKLLGLLLISIMVFPSSGLATPTTLGAGEWDTILDTSITATSSGARTPIVYSGGGDLRVCVSGIQPYNDVRLLLYSDNGSGDSVDDFVPPRMTYYNNSTVSPLFCFNKVDARPHVDGSNNKAEFYLKVYSLVNSSDTVRVVIQD
ncbi:hypothetical protein [Halobacillus sp. Marseille-Q1614]|uniref:hypothetical protein n=1 Tax=Halobacillus sp. Marseille-Q1614 TaxID=2709134 RepID=UPI00157091D4|nr:hypothetical protein [Halobacillus sp. Marseille-Q1614]